MDESTQVKKPGTLMARKCRDMTSEERLTDLVMFRWGKRRFKALLSMHIYKYFIRGEAKKVYTESSNW